MPPDFKEVQVLGTFTGLQKNQVIQDILEKLYLLKETILQVRIVSISLTNLSLSRWMNIQVICFFLKWKYNSSWQTDYYLSIPSGQDWDSKSGWANIKYQLTQSQIFDEAHTNWNIIRQEPPGKSCPMYQSSPNKILHMFKTKYVSQLSNTLGLQ